MAYTVHEGFPGIGFWNWYNVSQTVGAGGRNVWDDVYLVQILLSYLRPYVRVLQDPSLKPLRIDGSCGPITQAYIESYQSHVKVHHPFFKPDGLVEPGKHYQYMSPSVSRGATIVQLNYELFDKAAAAHADIPTSPMTPAALRAALAYVV